MKRPAEQTDYKKVDWSKANCTGIAVGVFYSYEEARTQNSVNTTRYARSVCAACPIMTDCFQYALKHEDYGIWGGTTNREREFLKNGKLDGISMRAGFDEIIECGISLSELSDAFIGATGTFPYLLPGKRNATIKLHRALLKEIEERNEHKTNDMGLGQ